MILCPRVPFQPKLSTFFQARRFLHKSQSKPYSTMDIRPTPPFSPECIHWVLDWDGTITKKDTISALVNHAVSSKPATEVDARMESWRSVSAAYIDDLKSTQAQLCPDGKLPDNIPRERQFLAQLKAVEDRSLARVAEAGIFKDLMPRDLQNAAQEAVREKHVEIRDDFRNFAVSMQKDRFKILSVNWSRRFIVECLRESCGEHFIEEEDIFSNELEGIAKDEPTTGHIVNAQPSTDRLVSSGDKLLQLQKIREAYKQKGEACPIIYIGDSWTDIECLLEADLGICMRDEPMGSSQRQLADAFERLGVKCPRLSDWMQGGARGPAWVRGFREIEEFVQTLRRMEEDDSE